MKSILQLSMVTAALLTISCDDQGELADAYGNIETDEVLISAQGTGQLQYFNVEEGQSLESDEQLGLVDTLPLFIQKKELSAQKEVLKAQSGQLYAQVEVLNKEMDNLIREEKRVARLLKVDAATTKQQDDIEGNIAVVKSKIRSIEAQDPALFAQLQAIEAKELLLEDNIRKSMVINPRKGVVLTKFAEAGEWVAHGKPLYKVGDLESVYARVYVTGTQLAELRIGQKVKVNYDLADGSLGDYEGVVSYISSKSEFTPKTIQTREERVDLVYAVKVRIQNDGRFKIGMPVEIRF